MSQRSAEPSVPAVKPDAASTDTLLAALSRALAEAELLNSIVAATAGLDDLLRVLEVVLERLSRMIRLTGGSIALVEDEVRLVRAAIGPYAERALAQRLPQGQGRSWQVIESLAPFFSNDLVADGIATLGAEPGTELRSYIAVPLTWQGQAFGLLQVDSIHAGAFSTDDLRLLQSVATALAGSIELARRYTAEVRARERIEEVAAERDAALQQMNDMVTVLSHDLRDPLGTIYTSAAFLLEILPDAPDRPDPVRTQIAIVHRQAERMNRLIEDLLDLDRITRGALPVNLQPCDVSGLLRDAAEMLRPGVEQRGILFRTDHGTGPLGSVLADRERIIQVFSNLVGNAGKFTPSGGTITLGARAAGNSICYSVTDTGPGIAEEQRAQIFNRFWQGGHRDGRGIGLGLTIARGIVEAHGGAIDLTSRPGQGTTFFVTLPVLSERGPAS